MKGQVYMNLLDLIRLLDTNYSNIDSGYYFFMLLIDNCISENAPNPFNEIERDTVERGIRGQHSISKAKLKNVIKSKLPSRLVNFINTGYTEEKQLFMEREIRKYIPDFNSKEADFAYPCSDLLFQLIEEYICPHDKTEDSVPTTDKIAGIDTETPITQSAVQQFIQNQFNISQTGNGINIGHADKIEIRDGKVVTLK